MNVHATMFDWATAHDTRNPARQRFEIFDRDNPKVYELFKRFTLEAINSGRRKFGARLIAERIRWEMFVVTKGDDFKLNDHFTPFYVRKFVKDHPEHRDIFEMRSSVADVT